MKNVGKLFVCLIMAVSLIGCSSIKISKEESAKIYYETFIKGDCKIVAEKGLNQSDLFEEVNLVAEIKKIMNFSDSGFSSSTEISDEDSKRLIEAVTYVANKFDYTIEVVSEDKEKAEIKISSQYMYLGDIIEGSLEGLEEELDSGKFGNSSDMSEQDFIDLYMDRVIKGIEETEPSLAVRSDTFTFEKAKGVSEDGKEFIIWQPENFDKFEEKLEKMIYCL